MNTPNEANTAQTGTRLILSSPKQNRCQLDNVSTFHRKNLQILDNLCYSGSVMFSEPYQKALVELLDAAKSERNRLLGERISLDNVVAENTTFMREIEQQIKLNEEA